MTDLIKERALNETVGCDYWKDGVFTDEQLDEYCKSCGPTLNVNFNHSNNQFVAIYSSPAGGCDTVFTAEGQTIFQAVDNLITDMRRAMQCLAGEVNLLTIEEIKRKESYKV